MCKIYIPFCLNIRLASLPAFFLSSQGLVNSAWWLWVGQTRRSGALGTTNVFHLKLISPTHGRGLFGTGVSGAVRAEGMIGGVDESV